MQDEYRCAIDSYIHNLIEYNKNLNLISEKQPDNYYHSFHVQTSLELLELLDKLNFLRDQTNIYDLGSGNGLPGVILSIAGYKKTFLYEIDKRKKAFLEIIRSKLKLDYEVLGDYRVVKNYNGIIVTKAMDSINNIIRSLFNNISKTTKLFFLKGKNFQSDLDLALKYYKFDFMIHKSAKFDSFIIQIENIKKI